MGTVLNNLIPFGNFSEVYLNQKGGWLKIWGGVPACVLSSLPLVSNLFLRCKEDQLDSITRAGLKGWLFSPVIPSNSDIEEGGRVEQIPSEQEFLISLYRACFIGTLLDVALIWIAFQTTPFYVASTISGSLVLLLADVAKKTKLVIDNLQQHNPSTKTLSSEHHFKAVNDLISGGGKIEGALDSLLHYANSLRIAEILVAHGADVNKVQSQRDYLSGRTPLHTLSDPETIEFLIKKGAYVSPGDFLGLTPLHYLASGLSWKIGETLHVLSYIFSDQPLAAEIDSISQEIQIRSATLLLGNQADPNAKSKGGGYTPLHFAVALGHIEMVRLLLLHHADPTIASDSGKTAYSIAESKSSGSQVHETIVNLLKETTLNKPHTL